MPGLVPLVPGTVYHVYNRGVGRETLYRTAWQYRHFLRLLAHHVVPTAHVYAFALLPNHFHLVLRPRVTFEGVAPPRSASQALSNACNAYARTFNRAAGRTGTLFARPFQRKPVLNRRYAASLVRYVHENPVRHGFVTDLLDWPYTSFALLAGHTPTRLERREVLSWYEVPPAGGPMDAASLLRALPYTSAPAMPDDWPVDLTFEALVEAEEHLSGRET